ncbi:MAG: right-handed parallel beta-helix repeat-containing protein [Candidatus Eisenbacteria sp.]|nr:right-handed parallel beta-helix repeat-containing protein [Candidatus Eisenbacteria bacterium]
MWRFLICALALSVFSATARPTTHFVRPDGMGDYLAIQDAVDSAADGDTILLASGTFSGIGNRDIDYLGKEIALVAEDDDPRNCVIDCGGSAIEHHRGFVFHSGESGGTLLEGVTIANAYWAGPDIEGQGGAISIRDGSVPLIRQCVLIQNLADFGGGIYCRDSAPTIENCVFGGNTGAIRGAGFYNHLSAGATLHNCTFYANSSLLGSAISCRRGTIEGFNCILFSCTGGDPAHCDDGDILLSCCDIFENETGDWVGCIADQYGQAGNFSADPRMCDPENGDYHLLSDSPCAPSPLRSHRCGLIGAWEVGCSPLHYVCCVYQNCSVLSFRECNCIEGDWIVGEGSCDPDPCGPWTYRVSPDGTGDFETIQEAIGNVRNIATIELENGVFTGPGNRDVQLLGKEITIRSASGIPDSCTIDCGGSAGDPHRGFVFDSEGPTTVLDGFRVIGGYADRGGAILCQNASPSIRNCTFESNFSDSHGGGAYCSGGEPSFVRCRFLQNSASLGGGGAFFASGSVPEITYCEFTGNTVLNGGGGAIHAIESHPVLYLTLLISNIAPFGAGLVSQDSDPVVTNCTFYENHASSGAGIWISGGLAEIENTIIAASTFGDAVHCDAGYVANLGCCDLFDNAGGDWVGCIDWQLGLFGNISADPLLCDPAGNDYHVMGESPCTPYSEPNKECDLIGARGTGCDPMRVPGSEERYAKRAIRLAAPSLMDGKADVVFEIDHDRVQECRLGVYDLSGRLVRTLTEGLREPGVHAAFWDCRDALGHRVSPGIYFLRLRVANEQVTRRLVVVR